MNVTEKILSYDVNEIHRACEIAGHTTDWEYFEDELKTYTKEDSLHLLAALKEQEEE